MKLVAETENVTITVLIRVMMIKGSKNMIADVMNIVRPSPVRREGIFCMANVITSRYSRYRCVGSSITLK